MNDVKPKSDEKLTQRDKMSDRDHFVRVTSDPAEEESSDSMSILRSPIDVSIFRVVQDCKCSSQIPNPHIRLYL